MSNYVAPDSPALTKALQLLEASDLTQAQEVVAKAVEDAKSLFGAESPEYASAQSDLATVYASLQQFDLAVAALREACRIDMPDNKQATRDRLTHVTNLGRVLQMAGRLDEAAQVFLAGLEGREAFYGRDHPGYAFGLEPLAALLLRRGETAQAVQIIREAVSNYWKNGHPRIANALAWHAEIVKTAAPDSPAFPELDELPDELIDAIASALLRRLDEADSRVLRTVLEELAPILVGRLGEGHPTTVNAMSAVASLERSLAQAFRDFVMGQLPAGLIHDVEVTPANDDFRVQVHTEREPTAEEREHIERVVQHALGEFRQRGRE
jgi:tetratricopeptide (TPR) repeat protein